MVRFSGSLRMFWRYFVLKNNDYVGIRMLRLEQQGGVEFMDVIKENMRVDNVSEEDAERIDGAR